MESSHSANPWAAFHQAAVLCGIWLLVFFVGVHTMSAMRAVLVPLLWAFFLMMGLVPAASAVEGLLLLLSSGAAKVLAACLRPLARCLPLAPACCRRRKPSSGAAAEAAEDGACGAPGRQEDEEASEAEHRCWGEWRRQLARFFAVIFVIGCFLGVIVLFLMLVIQSAEAMKSNWRWYQKGAVRIAANINEMLARLSNLVPPAVVDKVTENALQWLEDALTALLKPVAENVTSMLVELIMMLLYMVFWLCNPIEINTTVAGLFKRYILLKGLVSLLYAGCVWFLLYMLTVDLAVVFGCFTFLLNFVPEVGPFIAAVLPAPVILFDGRLPNPWFTLAVALGGELGLKFFFGNIFEVKLIESDHNMKMHPVVILFCVAFFGWVWGPTGMLLSVPIMASVKVFAQREAMPPIYRDGVLRLLEGAKQKPSRGDAAAASDAQPGPVAVFEQVVRLVSSARSPAASARSPAVSARPADEETGDGQPPAPFRQPEAGPATAE